MSSSRPLWRIYYGDGSTFDSSQGEPAAAPAANVQHVVCRDTRNPADPAHIGRYIVSGKDYYWYDDGEWWGGDIFGFYDYLARPGLKVTKFGRSVPNRVWMDVYRRANNDPDFPPKSAYKRGEYNAHTFAGQNEDSSQ